MVTTKKPAAKPANNQRSVRGIDPDLIDQVRIDMIRNRGKYPNVGSWINEAIKEKLNKQSC